ncbi:MAG: PKD domain-containing protein [Crocinitomix sp.]|nr:PKD domain-containing protein [Crocinitomix sp.]
MLKIVVSIILIGSLFCLTRCKKEEALPLATADFFVENNGAVAPCQLYFYSNSINEVDWSWRFGNGDFSSNMSDSSVYDTSGVYEVSLTVSNADGIKDSIKKTISIN